jgi:nucleotide-binding universal stress UspA family protein
MKSRNFKNILVPVDFSGTNGQAIETARELGRRSDAAIYLVHVHEHYYPVDFMAPGAPVPMSMITLRDDAERIRQQLAALARKFGIAAANCYFRNDYPVFNGVCKVARQIGADLIVLQTHGRTGIQRVFEGSHAERIVQHSPCPVLVVRKHTRKAPRIPSGFKANKSIDSILVPVDFSQSSFEALEYAIDYADRVAARLIVFHAVHFGQAFTADSYTTVDLSNLIEKVRRDAEEQMHKFTRLAKLRGVQSECVVKTASPASEICALADQRDVDLIITATHGRTGLKHLLMGSVAEQVVRHAHQPVLVVPSHSETRAAKLTRATRVDQQSMTPPARNRPAPPATGRVKKGSQRLPEHPFPERRKTNKFRESHSR